MTRIVPKAAAVAGITLAVLAAVARPASAQQGWATTASALSPGNYEAGGGQVAFDATGRGFAVYAVFNGTTVSVWFARFDPAYGVWRLPATTLSPPGQETLSPRVAVDGAGNAVVTWIREAAGVYYVQGLTFNAATETWSAPVDIAMVGPGGAGPDLAVTPGGDAVVVWTALTSSQPLALSIHAARYAASSGTWSAATQISTAGDVAALARVAVAPSGNAVAAWSKQESDTTESVQAVRFVAASGTWLAPQTLSAAAAFAEDATVAMDDLGNAVVAWHRPPHVEVARYDAAGNTWSTAAALSINPVASGPALAGDHDGNTTVVWQAASGAVETSRYDAGLGTWAAAVPIAGATASGQPAAAADAAGNVAAFWPSPALPGGSGQGARYVRGSGTWAPVHTLPTAGTPEFVAMAGDGAGSFGVIWNSSAATPVVYATRWSGAPKVPAIVSTAVTAAGIEVHLTPPVTDEAAFAPTAYEYSLSTRPWVQVPFASPVVVPRPFPGQWYIAVRAVNAAGGGAETGAGVTIAPDPPANLAVVAVTGSLVTLAWEAPPDAISGFTYVVEGGLAPGQVLASIPTGSAVPAFTFTAPTGVFHVRVRSAFFQFVSQPSNEVVLAVNAATPPSAPAHLLGIVNGSAVALSWTPTFAGGAPTSMSLVVNGPVSGTLPLGLTDSFQFPSVPPGTYTFRVIASNGAGPSPPSNAVTLTFPGACSSVPGPPRRLVVERATRTLSLSWSPPEFGGAVSHYVLYVSGAFAGAFPLTGRAISAPVPPGSYSFQVQAANACGDGGVTPLTTVVVP